MPAREQPELAEIIHSSTTQRLDLFDGRDLHRGAGRLREAAWIIVRRFFIMSSVPWPMSFKAHLLRLFGAKVGENLYIRPRVYVHFPWKLSIGDHCWIGEGCEILNLEAVTIGSHAALAHFVYIAAAGHDISSRSLKYANKPVIIESESWIGTRAFIGPGVVVGRGAVVAAGAVVVKSVSPEHIVGGVPAETIGKRLITKH